MKLMLLPEDGFVEPIDINCDDRKFPSSAMRGAEIVVEGIKDGYGLDLLNQLRITIDPCDEHYLRINAWDTDFEYKGCTRLFTREQLMTTNRKALHEFGYEIGNKLSLFGTGLSYDDERRRKWIQIL